MTPRVRRERSGSELVFGALKALMVSYHLWGAASRLGLAQLSGVLRTTEPRLGGVLNYLALQGLVSVDLGSATVQLTDSGVRALLVDPCS